VSSDPLKVALFRVVLDRANRVLRAERWPSGRELTPEGTTWLMRLVERIYRELRPRPDD
jgi:hypothetical protein